MRAVDRCRAATRRRTGQVGAAPRPGGGCSTRKTAHDAPVRRAEPVRKRTTEVGVILGCLALNASFEPLTMVPVKRALRLVIDGKAEIVESDPARAVRSERLTMPRPAVIRLTRFIHVPRRFRRQVTNTFLFARDRYRCQYCGRAQVELKPRESLTRDHVIPMSRGGTNEWANVVTACSPCNLRKADHYPHEIGMHPMTVPAEPHFVHLSWAVRRLTPTQAKYIRVFYGDHTVQQLAVLEGRAPLAGDPLAAAFPPLVG